MTAFFEHQRTSFRQDYLRNLIALAAYDGQLTDDERIMIYRIGKSRGLKVRQVDTMLSQSTESQGIFIPESPANRMNLLFDLMQIVYADGTVNAREIEFIRDVVDRLHLRTEIVDHLVDFFQYGAPSTEDWIDFSEHISLAFAR